jgi:hypothetical protein
MQALLFFFISPLENRVFQREIIFIPEEKIDFLEGKSVFLEKSTFSEGNLTFLEGEIHISTSSYLDPNMSKRPIFQRENRMSGQPRSPFSEGKWAQPRGPAAKKSGFQREKALNPSKNLILSR